MACRARAAPPALRLRSQRLSVCWLPAPPLRAPSWAHAACSVPRQLGEFPALRRQPAACSAARRRASRHNDAAALRCRATRRMRARSTPSGPIPCSLTLIVAFSSPLRSANAVNVTSRAAPWFPGTDAPAHLTGELAGDEVAFPDQHQELGSRPRSAALAFLLARRAHRVRQAVCLRGSSAAAAGASGCAANWRLHFSRGQYRVCCSAAEARCASATPTPRQLHPTPRRSGKTSATCAPLARVARVRVTDAPPPFPPRRL